MSKFRDALSKVGDDGNSAMGFSPLIRNREKPPQLLLVGFTTPEEILKTPKIAEANVDALLINLDSSNNSNINSIKKFISDRLWGVHIKQSTAQEVEKLRDIGCDFFVFEIDSTEAHVLNDDASGKMLSVTGNLSEDLARGINDLLIDGMLFTPTANIFPLSIFRIVEIGSIRALLDKPIVMAVPTSIKAADLNSLATAGITAVAIPLSSLDKANKVKKAISLLPQRKTGSTQRDALIPHGSDTSQSMEDQEADDEEFEEEELYS